MKKNRTTKTKKGSVLCWMLVLVMMLTSVQVPAAVFDAPAAEEDLFSSGSENDGYVQQPQTETETGQNTSDQPDTGEGTLDSDTELFAGDQEDTGSNTSQGTKDAKEPDTDVMLFQEDSASPASLIHNGDPVIIRFADNKGQFYYDELETETKMGESILVPEVPGFEDAEGSGWKLDPDTPDEEAILLEGGESLKLSLEEDLDEYIVDGVLTFYAVQGKEMCTVTFYNNSGTGIFSGGKVKVAKGNVLTLPDYPSSKYVNFGWTTAKSGRTVQYKIGETITVSRNLNLYMIRYATSKVVSVKFLNPSGSSNTALKALESNVVKGSKLKLPSVPAVSGYTNLGWSTKKNAAAAAYLAGKTVTVSKNMTLYAVRKKVPTYTVSFNNNSGTSTSKVYTSLSQRVAQNNYVILPELPKASGYQNIGWTTTRKGTKPIYKAGSKIKVTKNMKFYTVRQKSKYYTVSFYLGNGGSNSTYKAFQRKVEEDTMITLPNVPPRDGYLSLGWATKKNASVASNREGTKFNVTENTSFYAVQYQSVSVVLHYNSGGVYKTISVGKGSSLKLPSVTSKLPYTFLGWSRTPYQTSNPDYEAGETIAVNAQIDLYAVVFNRTVEEDISSNNLAQPDTRKYKQVIFVGDSRTNRMNLTLGSQFQSSLISGATFISQEGGGLSWMKSTGYEKLMSAVGGGSTSILEKPTAVIFNLGVNDLYNRSNYVTYMNSLAAELKSKGCKLYYMSVNPVNSKMIEASGHTSRAEEDVRQFNSTIRTGLSGNYTYIDTYTLLANNGYGSDAGTRGVDIGVDDGLHYTTKTYKRIYNYCIKTVNNYR